VEYVDAVKLIAPCGLDCSRCADYKYGGIKKLSTDLLELLGNYERVAAMKSRTKPFYANYSHFKELLSSFTQASCGGCRDTDTQCPIPDICIAGNCSKEKGVDFCFQCSDYPCERQSGGDFGDRWKKRNDRMKEVGVIQFYEEQKRLPRY